VACLLLLAAGFALAGDEAGSQVKLEGWIVDEWCGKANANAEGKDCILKCRKDGSPLVFFSEDKLYKLSDQKGAEQHVGYKVLVTGTLEADDTIKVTQFAKAPEKDDKRS
jgi:hypothetical protein